MSDSALFIPVQIAHRLGIAVRLFDFFTGETVRVPMTLSIPDLRIEAFRADTDHTFRFLFTNRDVPAGGPFAIQADIPGGEYEAREPMQASLPVVVGHPPPVIRSDYLVEFPLWPTRARNRPPAETDVIGRVISAGVTDITNLRIFLFELPGSPPLSPYAYTNVNGEFLFRLPQLRAHMSGSTPVLTTNLGIQILDNTNAVVAPVTPASFTVGFGSTTFMQINVP